MRVAMLFQHEQGSTRPKQVRQRFARPFQPLAIPTSCSTNKEASGPASAPACRAAWLFQHLATRTRKQAVQRVRQRFARPTCCNTNKESVLLSCSNSPSWPSRSRCLVSVVTQTRKQAVQHAFPTLPRAKILLSSEDHATEHLRAHRPRRCRPSPFHSPVAAARSSGAPVRSPAA